MLSVDFSVKQSEAANVVRFNEKGMQELINSYMHLTKDVLPSLAKDGSQTWPVVEDHCFQRIVLDTICGGVWYEFIDRPAYKHLTMEQVSAAVQLCEAIIDGRSNIQELNQQSLIWRGKLHRVQNFK